MKWLHLFGQVTFRSWRAANSAELSIGRARSLHHAISSSASTGTLSISMPVASRRRMARSAIATQAS